MHNFILEKWFDLNLFVHGLCDLTFFVRTQLVYLIKIYRQQQHNQKRHMSHITPV